MEQNISEYIIEMYRKEDMLRAYQFNLEKFGTQVINFFPISNKEKLAQVNYYEELMQKMKVQHIEQSGHLKELTDLVGLLDKLHSKLKSDDTAYFAVYEKAKPYIEENMKVAGDQIKSEIQICLNGVYGFLLLKIEGRDLKQEEQDMVNAFGDLLSLISFKYEEQKNSN